MAALLAPAALAALATQAALALLPAWAGAAVLEVRVLDAAGKPLPDAVVFLESDQARGAVKAAAQVDIAQAHKQFDPVVTVVPVGTAVNFPNRDTVRHHVYSFSPVRKFEIKLYVGTPAAPVVFDQPGIAVLGCNIHDQMTAWVVVVATPWYGKTAANGSLRLAAVPVHHQRALPMLSAQKVEFELGIQTRNPSHGREVVQRLADAGFEAQVY